MTETPRLLTESELAQRLQVSVATLRRWRAAHTGPAYVQVGRFPRYLVADVSEWLAQRRAR
jgi:predicted DNA-binding transcriptional regulator AlpA